MKDMRYKEAESQISDIHFRSLGKGLHDELLGRGVLGDSLGALRDGVLGQFTWEEEPDSSLDFPGGDGGPLVVVGQTGSLSSDPLKDVVDKGVHDAHGLGGDTSVRVDLLQHLVDVDSVRLLPLGLLLLVALLLGSSWRLASLLGAFPGSFRSHLGCEVCKLTIQSKNNNCSPC